MWHRLERPRLIQTISKRKQEEIPHFYKSTMSRTRSWPAGPTSFAWDESRRLCEANCGSRDNERGRSVSCSGSQIKCQKQRAVNPCELQVLH